MQGFSLVSLITLINTSITPLIDSNPDGSWDQHGHAR